MCTEFLTMCSTASEWDSRIALYRELLISSSTNKNSILTRCLYNGYLDEDFIAEASKEILKKGGSSDFKYITLIRYQNISKIYNLN